MASVYTFDPLIGCVSLYLPASEPYSLMYWCRKAILRSVGLRNLCKIEDLPIPKKLRSFVGKLTLNDFFIDAQEIPPDSHNTQTYPAICLIDNSLVNLQILQSAAELNTGDVTFITAFEENNQIVVVKERTKTLSDVIEQSREEGTIFDEDFLWLLMDEMIAYLIDNNIFPTTRFSPENIHFLPNRQIFIQANPNEKGDISSIQSSSAVYEAPEVISMANPNSSAFVWSIGCIIYECLALEPAFYDDGSNPFAVIMRVLENELPPEPTYGSAMMKAVVKMCLTGDPTERISLVTLQHIVQGHVNTNI